jgi:epoxyqueuosine reductase
MRQDLTIQKADLTQRIKAEAKRLGFDLVGITTPDPPPHTDIYQKWLEAERHGEMGYLETDRALRRRKNPLEILPECKSILVAGMNYLPEGLIQKAFHPRVSAYAQGEDYHDVIVARFQELVDFIQSLVPFSFPHRIYTDTGPILERELGQRAGLGWIGKNTCLIHPQMGSYFFLGEILLALELEFDQPFEKDYCGSCTRCLDACPTECILPDRTLDAPRCISYLTIELKNSIPPALRSSIGDWIFGCDRCQEVCPWNNRFAQPTSQAAFLPNPKITHASLADFLELSEESFRSHFHHSPLKRAKWQGILRNAAINAGNNPNPNHIPLLANLLTKNPHPIVRSHAAWALGQMKEEKCRSILESAKDREENPAVIKEITLAIEVIGEES